MKQKYNFLITAFLALWLVIGVTACSDDNSTGADDNNCNAFDLPSELTPVSISTEYFNSQNVPNDQDHSVYYEVQNTAITGNGFLSFEGNATLITSFLALAPNFNIQPESEGDNCVWNIDFAEDFPQFGIDAAIMVTASPANDQINWEVLFDGEIEDQVVENFLFLEGFTSNDDSTGEWNGYDPENSGSPAYTYTWDIESENNYELDLQIFQQGMTAASVDYLRSGVENNMSLNNGESMTNVYWNEETDSGWIEDSNGRRCYTDFVNSTCS